MFATFAMPMRAPAEGETRPVQLAINSAGLFEPNTRERGAPEGSVWAHPSAQPFEKVGKSLAGNVPGQGNHPDLPSDAQLRAGAR